MNTSKLLAVLVDSESEFHKTVPRYSKPQIIPVELYYTLKANAELDNKMLTSAQHVVM